MISLPSAVRIFACTEPTDMRKSFDGLASLAEQVVAEDPLSGHLFLFRNRRKDRVKILYWDRDGLAIWYKRLEQGTFQLPAATSSGEPSELAPRRIEMQADQLAMLLGGIDLTSVRRRKRYARDAG